MSGTLVTMELKGVQGSLYAFSSRAKELVSAAELGLRKGMEQFKKEVVRDQMTGRRFADFGLNVGHGTLRRSWQITQRGEGDNYIVKLATDTKYARIHQYGGTIYPKTAHALAIPISPEARGKSPRDFPDLVMVSRPGHPPLLIRQYRKGGSAKVAGGVRQIVREDLMFVLKKSVKMPKRLHIIEEFGMSGRDIIMKNIRGAVNLAAQKQKTSTGGFVGR